MEAVLAALGGGDGGGRDLHRDPFRDCCGPGQGLGPQSLLNGSACVPDRAPRSVPLPGKRECRVGQYVVDLMSFEQLALPVLRNVGSSSDSGHQVCVIDEIGKMELFSQPFIQAIRQTLSTPGIVVLGTIPIPKGKPLALVEEIRSRNDIRVFNVTRENRNHLLQDIVTCVQSSSK
ncbi:cancer-related nucleoside-triphosphatase isoform X2 [Erinaceus europaeus]|uniref:Cancer-related nucleoside-triphosphatase isoform X2 n=1 Tax=Erinaceus europaeus TaxID=9365 RepID=A0ABM3XGL3_ERIEU|nr:cancer-related nucleoside-triphosphatase isoform X2 [Erinaceus europaeus]